MALSRIRVQVRGVRLEVGERRERKCDMRASAAHAERKRAARSKADAPRPTIEVYTDSGCKGNPGVGAWDALIFEGSKPKEISGVERLTTNNQMELRAAIEGPSMVRPGLRIHLWLSSRFLLKPVAQQRDAQRPSTLKVAKIVVAYDPGAIVVAEGCPIPGLPAQLRRR